MQAYDSAGRLAGIGSQRAPVHLNARRLLPPQSAAPQYPADQRARSRRSVPIVDSLSDRDLGVLARRLLPHLRHRPGERRHSAYTVARRCRLGCRRRRFAPHRPPSWPRSNAEPGGSSPRGHSRVASRGERRRGNAHHAAPRAEARDHRPASLQTAGHEVGDECREDQRAVARSCRRGGRSMDETRRTFSTRETQLTSMLKIGGAPPGISGTLDAGTGVRSASTSRMWLSRMQCAGTRPGPLASLYDPDFARSSGRSRSRYPHRNVGRWQADRSRPGQARCASDKRWISSVGPGARIHVWSVAENPFGA